MNPRRTILKPNMYIYNSGDSLEITQFAHVISAVSHIICSAGNGSYRPFCQFTDWYGSRLGIFLNWSVDDSQYSICQLGWSNVSSKLGVPMPRVELLSSSNNEKEQTEMAMYAPQPPVKNWLMICVWTQGVFGHICRHYWKPASKFINDLRCWFSIVRLQTCPNIPCVQNWNDSEEYIFRYFVHC